MHGNKEILIIGASGFLGSCLLKFLNKSYSVIGTYNNNLIKDLIKLDVTNYQKLKKIISKIKPSIIIWPAAITSVEYCETEKNKTRKVNVVSIKKVTKILNDLRLESKFIYISTDYVFDGQVGDYRESDKTNPINEYGRQKLECEEIIQKNLSNYIIVRTTGLYGWEEASKNFVMQILKQLNNREIRRLPVDQIGNPTYVISLVRAIGDLIKQDFVGIIHITGSTSINRFQFGILIAKTFNLDKKLLIPVKTKVLGGEAKRPEKTNLNIDFATQLLDVKLMSVRDGLNEMKKEKTDARLLLG